MKIAITGHNRGIGGTFAMHLRERGHEIVGISRSDGEVRTRPWSNPKSVTPEDYVKEVLAGQEVV